MDMPKLLIANYHTAFCQRASLLLQDYAQVACCHSGTQTLAMIDSFHPDILLLDLMLPELDGLAVLHQIAARTTQPKTIITTSLKSDYVLHSLSRFPISYILPNPVDPQSLVFHICSLAEETTDTVAFSGNAPADTQAIISSILLRLGIQAKWNGFNYLLEGIPLYMQDPYQSVTKELYQNIGKRFGKTALVVEHSIRTAIKSAYASGDPDVWRQYFPADADGMLQRPSNKFFFAQITQFFHATHGTKAG